MRDIRYTASVKGSFDHHRSWNPRWELSDYSHHRRNQHDGRDASRVSRVLTQEWEGFHLFERLCPKRITPGYPACIRYLGNISCFQPSKHSGTISSTVQDAQLLLKEVANTSIIHYAGFAGMQNTRTIGSWRLKPRLQRKAYVARQPVTDVVSLQARDSQEKPSDSSQRVMHETGKVKTKTTGRWDACNREARWSASYKVIGQRMLGPFRADALCPVVSLRGFSLDLVPFFLLPPRCLLKWGMFSLCHLIFEVCDLLLIFAEALVWMCEG